MVQRKTSRHQKNAAKKGRAASSASSARHSEADELLRLGEFLDARLHLFRDTQRDVEIEISHGTSRIRIATRMPLERIAYDRAKALDYARGRWCRVSSDNYIGVVAPGETYRKVHPDTVFKRSTGNQAVTEVAEEPNGTVHPWSDLDDCAHFISNCIGAPAGGLTVGRDYPSGPYGILGADRLFADLRARGHIELTAEKTTDSGLLATISEGDLIFYWSNQLGRYQHVALFMGLSGKRITCHTYCRSDVNNDPGQEWNSVNGTNSYTFAKIVR
jgi:hypothetical protein